MRIDEHLKIQEELQEFLLGEDWRNRIDNVKLFWAVMSELGEFADSLGFKWWTPQKEDIENAKIEIVDIYHFILTGILLNYQTVPSIRSDIFSFPSPFSTRYLVAEIVKWCARGRWDLAVEPLLLLASGFFKDTNEFSEFYKRKAELNKERRRKGDKDGRVKYEGGKEDNERIKRAE